MVLNCCRQPATIFFTIFTAGSLLYKFKLRAILPSLYQVAKWPRDKPETACPPLFCKLFGINWKEAGTKIKLQSLPSFPICY